MSHHRDRRDNPSREEVRDRLYRQHSLLKESHERAEIVAWAVAKDMEHLGLDPHCARSLTYTALEAFQEVEEGTGEEPAEFALHITGHSLGSLEAAVNVVDEMMGLLQDRDRPLGVIGFTIDHAPGVTFTVKAPDITGAIRVGVAQFRDVISQLGVRSEPARVEVEPAELFWSR